MKKLIILAIALLPFTTVYAGAISKTTAAKPPVATDKTTVDPTTAQAIADKTAIANQKATVSTKKPLQSKKMGSAHKSTH